MTAIPTGPPTIRELVALFATLSDDIAHAPDTSRGLTALTAIATSTIAGVDFASVSRHRGTHYQTIAPTEPAATAADRLQYELGSGPCVDAIAHDHTFRSGNVRTDPRWPVYGPRTFAEFGVLSMLSIRLVLAPEDIMASLNLYSRREDAFTDDDATTASLLAAHGATALGRLIARIDAANLSTALVTARGIGIAMGVLIATEDITADQAFDLLRVTSQNTNRKISDVAGDVIERRARP